MKITDESKKNFIRTIHQNINEDTTTEEYEALVMNTRYQYLIKTIRLKIVKHSENETEKIWFNKDIEQAINYTTDKEEMNKIKDEELSK